MELSDIRIFLEIYKAGSISGAAEKLNTVQSNVTARLKKLEEELGADLFHRRSRGVEISRDGRRFLDYAERIYALAEKAGDEFRRDGDVRGELRIGSMETTAAMRLPAYLMSFNKKYPEVELYLETGSSARITAGVLEYRLEGGFVGGLPDDDHLEGVAVFDEVMAFAGTAEQLAAPSSVILFAAGCSYRGRLEKWYASRGEHIPKVMEFGSIEAIMGCARAEMGITFMPISLLENSGLRIQDVSDELARITTYFIRRGDTRLSPVLEAFMSIFQKTFDGKPHTVVK
jgi:DNA-binding transcriptional LysR family regulator